MSMVVSGSASRRRAETREVKCPECGTINPVELHDLAGTITVFCKECGEEIHLVFDRTVMDMELKRLPPKEVYAWA